MANTKQQAKAITVRYSNYGPFFKRKPVKREVDQLNDDELVLSFEQEYELI